MRLNQVCSWARLLGAVILAASCSLSLSAAESRDWIYRAWQTDDGLPDNSVSGVAQTADGYLWIATHGGLLRYNGADFEQIPLSESRGFPNRVIRAMHLDRRGWTWLGMERGAVVCVKPSGIQTFGVQDGLPSGQVSSIAEDREGGIWVAFSDGLCRIFEGKCQVFGIPEGLPNVGGPIMLASDSLGGLWFSRGRMLGCYRDGKLKVLSEMADGTVRICASNASGLWMAAGQRLFKYQEGQAPEYQGKLPAEVLPRVLFEDHSGALWIGTSTEGLFHFKDGMVSRVATSHPAIDCFNQDAEGNLWVGTNGGGLNQVRASVMSLIGREKGLAAESVRSTCEDSSGRLWAVMQAGGLSCGRDGRLKSATTELGWFGGEATCVAADRSKGVWVGTREQGLRYLDDGIVHEWRRSDGLASDTIRSILCSSNGVVWVATDAPARLQCIRDGKISEVKTPDGIRPIRAMAETTDGTIWIGTAEGLILKVRDAELVPEPALSDQKSTSVRSLCTTDDGALWIGYAGFGVGRLKNGKFARITTNDGLLDDYVSQIIVDAKGGFWMAGNRGLSQVRMSDLVDVIEGRRARLRYRLFGRNEGCPNLQPNYDNFPSVCQTRDGRLLFSMRSGLLEVEPSKILRNPKPPPVVIERVAVNDRLVKSSIVRLPYQMDGVGDVVKGRRAGEVLKFPPDHRKIEFDFTALSFASPEDVHFRYQLSDIDKDWIDAGVARNVVYPQLAAGNYRFHVIACNSNGVWNETGASFAFVVTPFFWQTWWFRAAVLIALVSGLIASMRYLFFRRLRKRVRQLKDEAALHRERARIARDMHDEVGAKLTRLSLLTEMASDRPDLPLAGKSDMKEISETARETILAFDEVLWAVNPRNDTLSDLINYVCRHAEDFFDGSSVQCVFDLPPIIPQAMLPTEIRHQAFLAAKEALNNVLKHSHADEVVIKLVLHAAAFELVFHDNGAGFDPGVPSKRARGGSGLENMQERIRGLGGRFECDIQAGQGTRICFFIPVSLETPDA